MFAGADRLLTELTLDNFETFGDFLLIHRGAVAAQKKLGDISRNWILSLEFPHQIFAYHITFKGPGSDRVDSVKLLAHILISQRGGQRIDYLFRGIQQNNLSLPTDVGIVFKEH